MCIYVEQRPNTPAATVAKQVFEAMHTKKYRSARLVDVTGKPKNKESVAKSDFEKAAEMANGKDFIEETARAT